MVVEKFRALKELFRYGERPMSFERWENLIIKHRDRGIPLHKAPNTITMTESFMKAFDEMLPVKDGRLDTSIQTEAVEKAKQKLEVGRGITVGPGGKHLLVVGKDSGYSEHTPEGSILYRDLLHNEIGSIHTHPAGLEPMPSSVDVSRILRGEPFAIVVSPKKVVTLLRSSKTPFYREIAQADLHMNNMGKRKSKVMDVFSSTSKRAEKSGALLWTTNFVDLSELNIIAYEAKRGKDIFVRSFSYSQL